jgi:hypothetical protein
MHLESSHAEPFSNLAQALAGKEHLLNPQAAWTKAWFPATAYILPVAAHFASRYTRTH